MAQSPTYIATWARLRRARNTGEELCLERALEEMIPGCRPFVDISNTVDSDTPNIAITVRLYDDPTFPSVYTGRITAHHNPKMSPPLAIEAFVGGAHAQLRVQRDHPEYETYARHMEAVRSVILLLA